MYTPAEIALWGPEEALYALKQSTPLGWRLALRMVDRYAVAELFDENDVCVWIGSNHDPKLLCVEGLGWLMTRNHKTLNPAWRPRAHEVRLHVPIPASQEPDIPDLDPKEVAAVYKNRR